MAKSKCSTCQYRQKINESLLICNYIGVTGHMRGCSAKNCTRYVRGKRIHSKYEEDLGSSIIKKVRG